MNAALGEKRDHSVMHPENPALLYFSQRLKDTVSRLAALENKVLRAEHMGKIQHQGLAPAR